MIRSILLGACAMVSSAFASTSFTVSAEIQCTDGAVYSLSHGVPIGNPPLPGVVYQSVAGGQGTGMATCHVHDFVQGGEESGICSSDSGGPLNCVGHGGTYATVTF